jgi:hypothetical protein
MRFLTMCMQLPVEGKFGLLKKLLCYILLIYYLFLHLYASTCLLVIHALQERVTNDVILCFGLVRDFPNKNVLQVAVFHCFPYFRVGF